MEIIKKWLDELKQVLEGHDALIQVQIDGCCYWCTVGDVNRIDKTCRVVKDNKNDGDFLSWVDSEITKAPVCEETRRSHRAVWKSMEEYMPDVSFRNVTAEYIIGYDRFLREKGYAVNTIGKHMRVLRRYVRLGLRLDLIGKDPFYGYVIRMEQKQRTALTESQRMKIERRSDSISRTLDEREVLDAFRFSCATGLRFSDLCRLSPSHIRVINKKKWLIIRTKKTGAEVRLPLDWLFDGVGVSILQGRTKRPHLFSLRSNRHCNLILERLMQRLGIHEHITFHTGRHTAATLLLGRGVPITTVQVILGHSSVKTTQIYGAVTDSTIVKDLKRSRNYRNLRV